jgi:hypothetical protein
MLAGSVPPPQFLSNHAVATGSKAADSFETHQMNFVNDNSKKVPACA